MISLIPEKPMADLPKPKDRPRKGKLNKNLLLGMLYVLFVIAAVGGMMLVDVYGEAKMGSAAKIHDAADDH
jgi:hypothetical protein